MAFTGRQPDISYQPDFNKYQTRSKQRVKTESLDTSLPNGFPARLESTLVWDGKDFSNGEDGSDDWLLRLNEEQLNEIDTALKYFQS